jgi:hypothetical protein
MTRTKLLHAGVIAGLTLGSFALGTAIAKGPAPKAPELTLLKDQTWTPLMKEGPLPAVAPIEGNGMKGAYMGYLKLPAGFESPPHSHTLDYWSVLVQGKMTHWAAAGGSEKDSKPISVGDMTFMPGKVEHVSKCYPGADCIMVIMQKGKSDFIVAKTAKKDEKAPAAAPAAAAPAAAPAMKAPAAAPAVPATKK